MANPLTSLLNRWTVPVGDKSNNYIYVKTKAGVNYGTKASLGVKKASAEASVFKKIRKELLASRENLTTEHEHKLEDVKVLTSIKHANYLHKHSSIYRIFFGGAEKKAYKALSNQIDSMILAVGFQKKIQDLSQRLTNTKKTIATLEERLAAANSYLENDVQRDAKTLIDLKELMALLNTKVEHKKNPRKVLELTKAQNKRVEKLFGKLQLNKKMNPEDALAKVQKTIVELEKKGTDAHQVIADVPNQIKGFESLKVLIETKLADNVEQEKNI